MEEKITDLRNLVEALSNYFEDSGEIDIETLDEIHSITLEIFKIKHEISK